VCQFAVSRTGVAIVGNKANVFDHAIFDSQIFDSIELIGDGHTAKRNQITHRDQAGGWQQQCGAVRQNVINE
jgi:hypothetical protein